MSKSAGQRHNERLLSDPVFAAQTRIRLCEQYGMAVDPADVALVEKAEEDRGISGV